ncbi:cytochrome P450 [Terrimonas alba]|uniref:cytochrome P450 n=1 Tax=Terrimonas alba TaxID=3349636 RepID=UPI0035F2A09A
MVNTLFLQSEMQDPYQFYRTMLYENPVFWDSSNNIWAIYSYRNCKAALLDPAVLIPPLNQNNTNNLNEYALAIDGRLARISNGVQHEISRKTALFLFENMQSVSLPEIINRLLPGKNVNNETDWVNKVCKRLPVDIILKSFDFNTDAYDVISNNIGQLIKLMLPGKTPEQVSVINPVSKEVWTITERHILSTKFHKTITTELAEKYGAGKDEILSLCVSNLIGLLIQSYDAGRGILSNSLLQVLGREMLLPTHINKEYLQKYVVETLRFDPPIHNTRRIAASSITIGNREIKKGQMMLIVLAAANRDPRKFNNPDSFNIERTNNNEHLTFGIGSHGCLAQHFSVNMATAALSYLFEKYNSIKLVEKEIQYEPVINARLPINISISLR